MPDDPHRYDDLIHLPHHVSGKHPQMSMEGRAAQFSPFAALTGYGEAVAETARLTDRRVELDDDAKSLLNDKLQLLQDHIDERPEATFTFFRPDEKKRGGAYTTLSGRVKRVDGFARQVVLTDGKALAIDEIIQIEGELLRELDERTV